MAKKLLTNNSLYDILTIQNYWRLIFLVRWVSVKEMIPDSFVSVLMYMPSEYPLPMVHEGYYANGYWYGANGKLDNGVVTYWSPMPEGPKNK